MELSISSPMCEAFQVGVTEYTPICPGVALEPETGDPSVTSRNLHTLYTLGRSILAVICSGKPDHPVLITFRTGESYLAAGFRAGASCPGTTALAWFLAGHAGNYTNDYEELLSLLESWPTDMAGPISLPSPR